MFFSFVLLTSLGICFLQKQHTQFAERFLPDGIQHWCPHTKLCQLEPSDQLPSAVQNKEGNFKPCCEPCSCEPGCGRTRNCCFEKYDKYKLEKTFDTVCKQLNNKVHGHRDATYYHMVDKCPMKNDSCRLNSGSAWGPFHPVYSRTNGMIYYNRNCAECHYQMDVVEFIPSLSCSNVNKPFSKIVSLALNELDEDCYIQFFAPTEIHLSTEVCHPFIIRDCEFKSGSRLQYFDQCNRFNATFYSQTYTYQNVYCYLCNRKYIPNELEWKNMHTMCPVRTYERNVALAALTVLLGKSSTNFFKQPEPVSENNICIYLEKANASVSTKTCVPVQCPEGQFRQNGTCKPLGHHWFLQNVQIYVKLTPTDSDKDLTPTDLHNLSSDGLDSPQKEFIWRPELNDWDMDLFYSVKENGTNIQYIVAVMYLKMKSVKPQLFLDKIDKAFQSAWRLSISGKSFSLKAEFNKHTDYEEIKGSFIPVFDDIKGSYSDKITAWSSGVTLTNDYIKYRLCITKLFFCELIDLSPEKYRIDEMGIFISSTQKYLGNAEYKFMDGHLDRSDPLRVCLSDVLAQRNNSELLFRQFCVIHLIWCTIYRIVLMLLEM